jgi:ABC-type nitrate/sulfonate/bicarbonate transport system substrate-binding protein
MLGSTTRRQVLAGGAAALAAGTLSTPALAQGVNKIKVIVFPGVSNFSILGAMHIGAFAKQKLEIDLINTPNSRVLREGLAKGEYQLGHAASDNAVAMVELAKADVILAMGGDNGFNHVVAQPEIKSFNDLRGKTVVVDAPNTAFALILYKVLQLNGLARDKDYKVAPIGGTPARYKAMTTDKANAGAGIMNPPWLFRALDAGLRDLGPTARAIGAYQSDSLFVMRDWAKANSDSVTGYIRGYVQGRRWVLDRNNREAAAKLLADRVKLPMETALRAYDVATDPKDGMTRDAAFDWDGFRNVLALRAEIEGQWGGKPPAPEKYVDLSYYGKAIAGI